MLKGTRISNKSYPHEHAAADLFAHYYPYLEAWKYEPIVGEIRADRGMKLEGKTYYFEVDRDTENIGIIQNKIDAYIRYGRETGERFHVIFDIVMDNLEASNARMREIGQYLDTIHRGNQFCLSTHLLLTESDVTEKMVFTPSGRYSIYEL
jgi:hypothetical protein